MKSKEFQKLCQEYKIPKKVKRAIRALIKAKVNFYIKINIELSTHDGCHQEHRSIEVRPSISAKIQKRKCK